MLLFNDFEKVTFPFPFMLFKHIKTEVLMTLKIDRLFSTIYSIQKHYNTFLSKT